MEHINFEVASLRKRHGELQRESKLISDHLHTLIELTSDNKIFIDNEKILTSISKILTLRARHVCMEMNKITDQLHTILLSSATPANTSKI
jgi:hypothetical protein